MHQHEQGLNHFDAGFRRVDKHAEFGFLERHVIRRIGGTGYLPEPLIEHVGCIRAAPRIRIGVDQTRVRPDPVPRQFEGAGEDRLATDPDLLEEHRARVLGLARVFGNAVVCEDAWVFGNAWVCEDAKVFGIAQIYGNAQIYGKAQVFSDALVFGNTKVFGNAKVHNSK